MKVHFNEPAEFLTEIRRDVERVERRILRLTVRRRYRAPFVTVSVVATAVVGPTIVALEHRVGEVFAGEEGTDRIASRVTAVLDTINQAAVELKLEVRTGVFEPTVEV